MHEESYLNQQNLLSEKIREKSQRWLIIGAIILIIAGVILASQHVFFASIVSGPQLVASQDIEAQMLSGNLKNLNITFDLSKEDVYETGYTYVTQTVDSYTDKVESESTDHEYYLTFVGQHLLVIEGLPNQIPSGSFTGVIMPLPTELKQNLEDDLKDIPELNGAILPYLVSHKSMFEVDQFWYSLIGVILLLWGGILVFKNTSDPENKNHYIRKTMQAAGYKTMEEFSQAFKKSFGDTETIKIGSFRMNKEFLYKDGFFAFEVYPLSQMYWAYKKIVQRKVEFIPAGKYYEIVMCFKENKKVAIRESEDSVEAHIMKLMVLCPEARFGYTK